MTRIRRIKKAAPPSADRSTHALLIINSTSKALPRSAGQVLPYLKHLGIPFDLIDLGKTGPKKELHRYPLIIVGHAGVAPKSAAPRSSFMTELKAAVDSGAGLVTFDTTLIRSNGEESSGSGDIGCDELIFNDEKHFITRRHSANIAIKLASELRLAPLSRDGHKVLVSSRSGHPLVTVASQGNGKVVQWSASDWMLPATLGPLGGLDDVFWRSLAWAARKPFVFRGLPPLVTMRVDDVAGRGGVWGKSPLYWADICARYGLKPWLGLFIYNLSPQAVSELNGYIRHGGVTAFPRAFGRPPRTPDSVFTYYPQALPLRSQSFDEFIYFNHAAGAPWSDAEAKKGLAAVDKWYAAHDGLPKSSYAIPHWYEMGANTLGHVAGKWGCEFTGLATEINQPYKTVNPWTTCGPFITGADAGPTTPRPLYYADTIKAGTHSLFNCLTEIRDDAGYEWSPDNDVIATINRGIRQLRRALDSMAPAVLFTRETDCIYKIRPQSWEQEIGGVVDGIRDYSPRFVTADDAMRIVRATKTSSFETVTYNEANRMITAVLGGAADVATGMYVFTDEGGEVAMKLIDIPPFTKGTTVDVPLSSKGV